MSSFEISMPHRHTVVYKAEGFTLEFEVELATNGVIFYKKSAKLITGDCHDFKVMANQVEHWLKEKFPYVDVDES